MQEAIAALNDDAMMQLLVAQPPSSHPTSTPPPLPYYHLESITSNIADKVNNVMYQAAQYTSLVLEMIVPRRCLLRYDLTKYCAPSNMISSA
jgi:hypothetical protein